MTFKRISNEKKDFQTNKHKKFFNIFEIEFQKNSLDSAKATFYNLYKKKNILSKGQKVFKYMNLHRSV